MLGGRSSVAGPRTALQGGFGWPILISRGASLGSRLAHGASGLGTHAVRAGWAGHAPLTRSPGVLCAPLSVLRLQVVSALRDRGLDPALFCEVYDVRPEGGGARRAPGAGPTAPLSVDAVGVAVL